MHPALQDMPSRLYMIQVSRSEGSFSRELETLFYSSCRDSLILDEFLCFAIFPRVKDLRPLML